MVSNPCSRCGKQRIPSKTWKERVETSFGDSLVIHTENICPDKECQKLVDKEIASQKKKRDKIKEDRLIRAAEHKEGRSKKPGKRKG